MFKRTLEYIATAGQSERLRDVRFEHRKRTNELNQLLEQCGAAEASFKLSLGQLGERKQNLHRGLRKACRNG
jgi:hypothetical protein